VSFGCRSTIRAKSGSVPAVGGAVAEPRSRRPQKCQANAKHSRLCLPAREFFARHRRPERNAPHHRKPLRIFARHIERVVDTVADPAWRHDDRPRDSRFIHHWQQLFGGEGLWQLRRQPRHPGPFRRIRLPKVDLGIDDDPAQGRRGFWTLGRPLMRSLRRQHHPGAQRAIQKCAA
jgi:hypothetical protein